MLLGTKVGLGPCHILLDGDQALSPQKISCTAPNFRLMFDVVKMDLDATWYGGRRRRVGPGHTVLDGNHPAPPTLFGRQKVWSPIPETDELLLSCLRNLLKVLVCYGRPME